jgi:ABC-2 type transport system ATP-binding protein
MKDISDQHIKLGNDIDHLDEDHVAVSLCELTKRFGDFVAVNNLSLTIKSGEIFGLLGPNGSGKTTIVNMMSGLSKYTSGQVKIFGYNIERHNKAIHAILGIVPQETALYEELNAWTNMSLHAYLYGLARSEHTRLITDMLKLVQLYDRRYNRVSTFSGGMKRRLALARALLHDPRLLCLDEPTLGVDVQSRRAIWDYILDLKKRNKTVILTTNYLEEANMLCDRIAIIDHGKLVALDTPIRLKQKHGDTIIEIETIAPVSSIVLAQLRGLKSITDVTQNRSILRVVLSGDLSVTGKIVTIVTQETNIKTISQREPNLEEIFLDLTGGALRD